jgi:transposase-like protein
VHQTSKNQIINLLVECYLLGISVSSVREESSHKTSSGKASYRKDTGSLTVRVIESGMEKPKIPIYCQHCKQKQVVHVYVRAGRIPMNNQTVTCIKCKKEFDVLVSDPIIGGPFPE